MTKPEWREFERLVSRIERTLAGESVTVKSPDKISCLTTGTRREVDVSIRCRVGSAEILVTVECRDREAAQDVTWIEQLAAKKKNIGAAKTIAVAASGFSAEATRIAKENAIDLRILDQITEDDIKSWMPLVEVIHLFRDCELTGPPGVYLLAERGDKTKEPIIINDESGKINAQPIFCGPNNEPYSLDDIWVRVEAQMKLFEKVPTDNKDYFVRLTVTPADDLQVSTPKGKRRVSHIILPLRLRWKYENLSLADAKIVRYKPADPAEPWPEQVRVEFATKQASSNNIRVGFQFQKGDAGFHLSGELIPGTDSPAPENSPREGG